MRAPAWWVCVRLRWRCYVLRHTLSELLMAAEVLARECVRTTAEPEAHASACALQRLADLRIRETRASLRAVRRELVCAAQGKPEVSHG